MRNRINGCRVHVGKLTEPELDALIESTDARLADAAAELELLSREAVRRREGSNVIPLFAYHGTQLAGYGDWIS